MDVILPALAAVLMAAAAILPLILRRLAQIRNATSIEITWWREFSAARYLPMERLFAQEDYDFLSAQPSFKPALYRALEAERRRVFRGYLGALSRDFDRLMAVGRRLAETAAGDRPDLARALLRRKLTFTWNVALLRCRLALSDAGLGRIEVRPLIDALDGLRMELKPLAGSAPPQAA